MRATWWWIDRWRKSTAYTDMTLAEQGAYRNLLDEVVLRPDGIIPEGSMARASGDAGAWPAASRTVLRWMRKVEGGWTNDTALEIKAKGSQLSEAQRKKANKRWHRDDAPASAPANGSADAGHMPPSPSPSPSPSPYQDPEQNGNDLVPLDGGTAPDPPASDPLSEEILTLFDYWRRRTGKGKAQLTPARRVILRARLNEEPGPPEAKLAGLKLAVDGAVSDKFFNGSETGRAYLDFENIFQNRGRNRIEKLQRLATAPEKSEPEAKHATMSDRNLAAAARFIARGAKG